MSKKRIIIITAIVSIIGFLSYMIIGRVLWNSNVAISGEKIEIFIPSNSSFEDVVKLLSDSSILISESSFRTVAKIMKYDKLIVPAGKYIIKNKQSNKELISKLRSGNQDPQKVVINNIRTIHELAGKASRYFESDSIIFLNYLTDPTVANNNEFLTESFLTMFIPNTYEMFWTTTP